MIRTPEVSVIIPSYNGSHCVREAVDSVLDQDGIDPGSLEIVVVDDGSTDGTEEVLKSYMEKGSVTYIRQQNGGAASARNRGIRGSSGEYVCFLDADDTLYRNSIHDRLSMYRKYPHLGLVFTDNRKIIRKNGRDITYRENDLRAIKLLEEIARDYIRLREDDFYILSKDVFRELVLRCFIWTGTVMTRRAVLEDVGDFSTGCGIAEDHDLWIRICRTYDIGFRDRSTADYVLHGGGVTSNIPVYYDSSIKVRGQYLEGPYRLSGRYLEELRKQIASFFFAKGYYYYENASYPPARRDFLSALRYNRLALNPYLYAAATLLPDPAIEALRQLRRRIVTMIGRREGASE